MRKAVMVGSAAVAAALAGSVALAAADYPAPRRAGVPTRAVAVERHVVDVQPYCYVLGKAFDANRPSMPSRQHVYPFYVQHRVPCDPRQQPVSR